MTTWFAARRLVSVVALTTHLLASTFAGEADAEEIVVSWDAPDGCPGQAYVVGEIERLREGRPPPVRAIRATGLVLQGGADPPRLQLSLTIAGAATERVIDGDSCAALANAAALLIVIATEGDAKGPTDEPSSDAPPAALPTRPAPTQPTPTQPTPTQPTPTQPPEGVPAPAPSDAPPNLDMAVRVFGAIDVAALPNPAPGLGAGGALRFASWRLELNGLYFPEQRITVEGDAGADISLLLTSARVCWMPLRDRVELAGCLGGEAGVEKATSFGVVETGGGTAPWLAPQAALVGHYRITAQIAAFVGLELAVPLAKERFVLVGVGDVHGVPDATARATLGMEIRP